MTDPGYIDYCNPRAEGDAGRCTFLTTTGSGSVVRCERDEHAGTAHHALGHIDWIAPPTLTAADHGFPVPCRCCDDPCLHFADLGVKVKGIDVLRDWLVSEFRVEGIEIDLHNGPEFATAADAETWLDEHDRIAFVEWSIEDALQQRSGRSL